MVSRKRYITVILLLLCLSLLAYCVGIKSGALNSKLGRIQTLIEQYYPFDYDEALMEEYAAKALAASLDDPYTEYFTAEEFDYFSSYLASTYEGIGVGLYPDKATGEILISEIYPNSPASRSDLSPGDVLLSVDDYPITYYTYDNVIYYISGSAADSPDDSTPMHFTYRHDGEVKTADLLRGSFDVPTSEGQWLENGIYYLRFHEFSENAAEEFREALAASQGASALILDLRGNGGGYVHSLVDIASNLLPEGLLFYTQDAAGQREDFIISDNDYLSLPLVILTDGSTASASEILTGAVKEAGRGVIIGETTYGKGLVQALFPLKDGSALKLTIAKYYTPSGQYINEVGISPDIEVPASRPDEEDAVLTRAIDYLKSQQEAD